MRRVHPKYWLPVCLSNELRDLPKAVRIHDAKAETVRQHHADIKARIRKTRDAFVSV
ncbi:MAG: hypothetical protein OXC14_04465 [Rhodospirillaceae bacterium]|nr:hypothetical protein [Rhodospirillaceae bacterium]